MTQRADALPLLCRLLAANWDPESPQLPASIPWPDIAYLAQLSGVGPLLHNALAQLDGQGFCLPVPGDLRESWRLAYYQVATTNLLKTQDLGQILAAFSAAGVPVLALKGLAVADTLYSNLALRVTGDADLLVPIDQVPVASTALHELGFVPTEVELAPGYDLVYRGQQGFIRPGTALDHVEIHWHLLDVPYYLSQKPMDWFWDNSRHWEVGGQQTRILNREANLLYLSAHLAIHHRLHGLRWFVDLALLVQEELDWEQTIDAAGELELLLALRETVDRLASYWPSLPLQEPRRRLQALEAPAFERKLFRLLTAEPRGPFLDFYTDLVCLPDLPARLRFLLLNVFPRPSYMAARYHVDQLWRLPYWYLYRLADGAAKLARTLPQVLRLRKKVKPSHR